MKIFLSLLAAILILPIVNSSATATPVGKDMATAYFENCKAQPAGQGLSARSQELMCACTAAQMMNTMQVEDIQLMGQPTQAGRLATNKMIINVYAPCIQYPAKDHYYNECMTNPDTQKIMRNTDKLCDCMSNKVTEYLKQNGQSVFQKILNADPNIIDPMTALTNDAAFQRYARSQLLGCVTR